jgi:hypothetical protein
MDCNINGLINMILIILIIIIFFNLCNTKQKTTEHFYYKGGCPQGYLEVGGDFDCCPSGNRELYAGYHYCTGMPNGNTCFSNAMCASDICWTGKDSGLDSAGTVGVCVSSEPCNPNNGFLDGGCGSAKSVIQTIEAKDGAKLTVAAINAIDNIIGSFA